MDFEEGLCSEDNGRKASYLAVFHGCKGLPSELIRPALLALPPAQAFQINPGAPGLRAVWGTPFKYSNAFRVKSPSLAITFSSTISATGSAARA